MNCCDANGNCNQGRDCPVRKKKWEDTKFDTSNEDKTLIEFSLTTSALEIAIYIVCVAAAISYFIGYF